MGGDIKVNREIQQILIINKESSKISGESSGHNLSLDMLINLRTQTESHVMQLRRDNNA